MAFYQIQAFAFRTRKCYNISAMENPYSEILDIMSNPCTPAQESLKNALVRLLGGNKLSDISVKELCKCAFIARSTFYAYYNNIDEILEDVENDMLYKLVHMNGELMNRNIKETNEVFFYSETLSLIEENRTIFYTLLVANPDWRFISKWKKAIKYHFWERIQPAENAKNIELVLEITASAAIGAYTFWLTRPYEVDKRGAFKILSDILKTIDSV